MKVARTGVRLGELAASGVADRLRAQLARIEPELAALAASASLARPQRVEDDCRGWARRLEPFLCDTEHLLHRWLEEGQSLLFEGAQGSLLDVDHGTYPFVTSSSPTAGGAATGTGVPPTAFDGVLGIVKAYTTRVGGGPFPGELLDAQGEYLRKRGNEFGTVTGRPRRCGWFDTVAVRYAQRLNGAKLVALTKLDVLDELAEIPVCVGYRYRNTRLDEIPADVHIYEECTPIYENMKGWKTMTGHAREWAELPVEARDYVKKIGDLVGVEVPLVSVGPDRDASVIDNRARTSSWLRA
jgi:adenylosuccinate synthase